MAAVWITLAKTERPTASLTTTALDWKGALLGTAGLGSITFSLMQWETGQIYTHLAGLIGIALLGAFVYAEKRVTAPMMPLDLFQSRTFTGSNLLTFFLYAALAATLFYLPLNLIQIQGYSPTQAGAAMLPLVLIMFTLSRWAGGLLARYGAKLPLIVGPLITAGGYGLLARPGVGDPYWKAYLPAMMVLGFGMTITVAPLTTVIMSSVNQRRAGAASGINNAVSQTAALIAIAICSPLFYQVFSHSLTDHLQKAGVSRHIAEQIELQRRGLGAIQTQDASAKFAVDESFVAAFRSLTLLAGASAAAGGITAAFTIRNDDLGSGS